MSMLECKVSFKNEIITFLYNLLYKNSAAIKIYQKK